MKKLLSIGITAIILIIIVYFVWQNLSDKTRSQVPPSAAAIAVTAATAKYENLTRSISAIGDLYADQSAQVSPELPGIISKIFFKDGATIKKGDPLYQLDDEIYRAVLAASKANYAMQTNNYNRIVALYKKNVTSKQEMDKALADYVNAQQQFYEDQVKLGKMNIKAPFSGVIGSTKVDAGNYVTAGQPLASLVQLNPLQVRYSVPENYAQQLKTGQTVVLKTAAVPGENFSGVVNFVAPMADESTHTIDLIAAINNQKLLLKPGFFVTLSQNLATISQALVIPERALVPTIEGPIVYVIENNQVKRQRVDTGQRDKDLVQITKGLTAGQMVVVTGQQKLSQGSKVKIMENS